MVTAHFEQVRDGVQLAEAHIYLEQALVDAVKRAKLGDDLAKRCQAALDERILFGLYREVTEYRAAA